MLVLDIDIFLVMLTSHTDIALPAQIRVFNLADAGYLIKCNTCYVKFTHILCIHCLNERLHNYSFCTIVPICHCLGQVPDLHRECVRYSCGGRMASPVCYLWGADRHIRLRSVYINTGRVPRSVILAIQI